MNLKRTGTRTAPCPGITQVEAPGGSFESDLPSTRRLVFTAEIACDHWNRSEAAMVLFRMLARRVSNDNGILEKPPIRGPQETQLNCAP